MTNGVKDHATDWWYLAIDCSDNYDTNPCVDKVSSPSIAHNASTHDNFRTIHCLLHASKLHPPQNFLTSGSSFRTIQVRRRYIESWAASKFENYCNTDAAAKRTVSRGLQFQNNFFIISEAARTVKNDVLVERNFLQINCQ